MLSCPFGAAGKGVRYEIGIAPYRPHLTLKTCLSFWISSGTQYCYLHFFIIWSTWRRWNALIFDHKFVVVRDVVIKSVAYFTESGMSEKMQKLNRKIRLQDIGTWAGLPCGFFDGTVKHRKCVWGIFDGACEHMKCGCRVIIVLESRKYFLFWCGRD